MSDDSKKLKFEEVCDADDTVLHSFQQIVRLMGENPEVKAKYSPELDEAASHVEELKVMQDAEGSERLVLDAEVIAKIYDKLDLKLCALLGKCFFDTVKPNSANLQQYLEIASEVPVSGQPDKLLDAFAQFVSDEAMVSLQPGTEKQKMQALAKLRKKQDKLRKCAFYALLCNYGWSEAERDAYERLLLSPLVDELTTLQLVGAIVVSGTTFFDYGKFHCLFELYQKAESETLRQYALVGFLLISSGTISITALRLIRQAFSDKLDQEEREGSHQFLKDVLGVQKLLTLSVASEPLSKKLARDMHHAMGKSMFRGIQQKIEDLENGLTPDDEYDEYDDADDADDANDESGGIDELFELPDSLLDEETNNLLDDMSEQGVDCSIAHFPNLASAKFFDEMANWLLPFDPNHPMVLNVEKLLGFKLSPAFFRRALTMSSLDAYGILSLAEEHPEDSMEFFQSFRMSDDEDVDDASGDETINKMDDAKRVMLIRRSFIRSLYRFYRYSRFADDFLDPFNQKNVPNKDGYQLYSFLSFPVFKDPRLKNLRLYAARYACKLENYKQVPWLLKNFGQETVEVHFMLAMAYQVQNEFDVALLHARRALDMKPDSMILRKLFCYCNKCDGHGETFVEQGLQLAKEIKDPVVLYNLQVDIIKVLLEMDEVERAVNLCYEVEYKNPDRQYIKALLCLCLLRRQGEHYEESVAKAKKLMDEDDGIFGGLDDKGTKKIDSMATFFEIIGTMMESDPEAMALFSYCHGLVALMESKSALAIEFFCNAYGAWYNQKQQHYLGFLLINHDSKWLIEKYHYSLQGLMFMRTTVAINHDKMVEKIEKYASNE